MNGRDFGGHVSGTRKLDSASLDELQERSAYKWDRVQNGTGIKDSRNWISGREFLAIAERLQGVRS